MHPVLEGLWQHGGLAVHSSQSGRSGVLAAFSITHALALLAPLVCTTPHPRATVCSPDPVQVPSRPPASPTAWNAAACGSTAFIASWHAAHSWQHLGRHALAALAAAGAAVRTLATAAFATAAADAPLVAPAELAAAAPRRHPSHACLLCSHWMEGHRFPGRDGSIRLPALDGRLCDGWPRHSVRGTA